MRTSIQLDRKTSQMLGRLAELESRSKVDELRHLVKKELEDLKLKNR